MKKIILILGLSIAMHIETIAQQEKQFTTTTYFTALKPTALTRDNTFPKNMYSAGNNGPDKDYDFYLRKSKSQRIVGWATLGAGLVLSGVGLLIASNSESSVDIYGNVTNDNTTTAAVITIAGAASGIVSIPFMIMASANKHKAKLMLKSQPTGFGVPPNVNRNITGISMSIPIGK